MDVSARGSETENRVAEFLFEREAISKRMSVGIRCQIITELPDQSISTAEIVQRYVIAEGGEQQRIDGQIGRLTSTFSPTLDDWESQLYLKAECLYISSLEKDAAIKRFQVKADQSEMRTLSRRRHPFDLTTTNHHGALFDGQPALFSVSFTVVSEDELKDGRFRSVSVSQNNLAGYVIIFAKEPAWAPESIRFYYRENAKLPTGRKIEEKDILLWNNRSTTTTTWSENQESGLFLPLVIRMEGLKLSGAQTSREYRFTDWKFGKDVDEVLLDKSHFTKEKISTQIDFPSLRKKFENKPN